MVAESERAAAQAEADRLAALEAAKPVVPIAKPAYTSPPPVTGGTLTGAYGYSLAGGNCVNQVPLALRASGNPISWPATSAPYIGGAVLFYYNHTGRITGFWSNGDIEIAQENAPGAPTRYPRSEFRGFR